MLRTKVPAGHLHILVVDLGDVAATEKPVLHFGEVPVGNVKRVRAVSLFCESILVPLVRANGCYQSGYHLTAAASRPLLATLVVDYANTIGANSIVHGFAGNDALRFATGVHSLSAGLEIVSFAEACGSRTAKNGNGITVSRNIAGASIEAGCLEQSDRPSSFTELALILDIESSMTKSIDSEMHSVTFSAGTPVMLDDSPCTFETVLERLNAIGLRYGVGWCDMVEDGHVGYKSRAVYIAPGLHALVNAHRDLERYVASPQENRIKRTIDAEWADLVYKGYWYDPARATVDAFIDTLNERVNGKVWLEFGFQGCRVAARQSVRNVDDTRFATYRAGQDFGASLIDEFSVLQSVPASLHPMSWALREQKLHRRSPR
ncbi:MAG: hypothetical protein PCALPYG88_7310 [uncultured Paraburkholderia sp.]|nr:MAG: hypothetical protein PCALPYG08_7150 [uncultured Paraburkholderia sp.]CAH2943187.1 MAG: hypothetical protein PCALPYG88_7310 [uncultured Paraburkholderia sp.]